MKAKITIRNMLFLVISVILLCSIMGISASAVNYDCTHSLGDDGWSVDASVSCREIKWCDACGDYAARPIQDRDLHNPGVWTEVTPNTCQQTGLEAIFCTDCGVYKFEERVIPAHDYEVLYGEEATCKTKGFEFIACLKCFDMKTVELDIDPDAHKFSEWQITTEATCVEKSGVRTKFCLCVDENGKQCDETITETYEAPDNHVDTDWSEYSEKIAPTCQSSGYLYKTCEGCSKKISKELPRHSEATWTVLNTVASTCHTNGNERRKCECGLEYDYALPLVPENHEYTDWKVVKEPSCTSGKISRYCEYHYDAVEEKSLLANGEHSFGEWVTVIEPDCSLTGLEKQTCADCGKEVTRVLPTKHDYTVWTTQQEMSCDESNLRNGSKLAKCNSCTYEKYFTIPALHSYGPWIIEKISTCENGNTGVRKRICETCGKVERENYVSEHDFSAWYVTSEPVCAKDGKSGFEGQRTRWCMTCNYYEHKAVPVTHEYEVVEIISLPTCEVSGELKVECVYCGKKDTQYPDAAGHKYGEAEIGKGIGSEWKALADGEITCGMDVTEKRTCIYCLASEYTNKQAGHTYGNWFCDGGITCGAGTKQLTRVCQKCNVTETAQKSLNHPNLKTVTTEATCSTSGYTKESCPDCGYSAVVGEITPAYGHELDKNWTTKVMPSCSSKGSRYKACANCDYIEYQDIARTEHFIMALETAVEPTCTTPGKKPQSYCTYCRAVFDSEEIPALGHNIPEGSEICTRCGVYEGVDCACACHSQSGIEKIFFNLINKLYQMFGINQNCKCGALHYEEVGFLGKLFGRG